MITNDGTLLLTLAVEEAASQASKKISPEKLLVHVQAVLPLLVRHAQNKLPITYGEISEQTPSRPAQNANTSFGAIKLVLARLSNSGSFVGEGMIPNISTIVRQKGKESSGSGAYLDAPKSDMLDKQSWLISEREHVYSYQRWPEVLSALGLATLDNLEENFSPEDSTFSSGESSLHKELKEWLAQNPQSLALDHSTGAANLEQVLHSSDRMDISFTSFKEWACVEVKTSESREVELLRGVFQIIKYQALMRATLLLRGESKRVKCILALGGQCPAHLLPVIERLSVQVVSNLENKMLGAKV